MPTSPIFNIQSPAFDIEHISNYNLELEFSAEALKVVVFEDKKLMILEEYNLEKAKNYPCYSDDIKNIFDDHIFLKANYWIDIKVYIESPFVLQMSSEIFDKNQIQSYEQIYFNEKINLKYCAFEFQKTTYLNGHSTDLQEFIEETYPSKNIQIQAAAQKIQTHAQEILSEKEILLIFSEQSVYMYFKDSQSLKLKAFSISHFQEYVSKDNFKGIKSCILYGKITTFSPIYTKMKSIVSKVEFGSFPASFTGLNFTAEIPPYKYLSVLI